MARKLKEWEHDTWGNSINFQEVKRDKRTILRVHGWLKERPENGDFLLTKMESGRIGRWKFENVEHFHNPNDMFIGDAVPDGYEEEISAEQ